LINTKLIIIDGMPGSGKSTTADIISERLNSLNINNLLFLETSEGNPLFINTPAMISLSDDDAADQFIEMVKTIYTNFVQKNLLGDEVVIIESVIFQGIVSVSLLKGLNPKKLLELTHFIEQTIAPLKPSLIYYYQMDVEKNWRRICDIRGADFANFCGLHTDEDFQRASNAWSETQEFVISVINNWSIPKLIIENLDYTWGEYINNIEVFLQLK
jgi:thymidylate kinase